ncbi:MAG: MMPL family transporter [Actinobacteria bacterium]|uniref:MMPL family transporter n=1 Tax=Candidatus Fonsibacter lacus TaxID=2576439 RepID=A0A965LKS2_9PROT|nr:MMPL family transporter [Candidatus Fonsibacter lacus]
MFEKLGVLVARRSKLVLLISLLTMIAAGAIGFQAFGKLDGGGYNDPKSESSRAFEYLKSDFKVEDPAVLLVIDSPGVTVDDQSVRDAVTEISNEISSITGVKNTLSYWSTGAPQLLSADRKAGYLFVYGNEESFDGLSEIAKRVEDKIGSTYQGLSIYYTGTGAVGHAINTKISDDLKKSESIAIPLTFLLLLFVFGGLIASGMPLVVGISAILGSFFIIYLLTLITDVSIYAMNLITGLGLGLGIDYSLLIVNRFREELHQGKNIQESVVRTVATAGRTVFFSGLTVLVTLASLLLFPLNFLKSFGYAGIAVVGLAVLGALIPLPATLALIGKRIDSWVIKKSSVTPREDGRWADLARFVMRKPLTITILTLILLGILAAPIRNIAFGQTDVTVLPKSHPVAVTSKLIDERFPGREATPVEFLFINGEKNLSTAEIADYKSRIKNVPGIIEVSGNTSANGIIRFQAIHKMGPRTTDAQRLINDIREIPAPEGLLIGGVAADYTDTQNGIARALPWALGWVFLSVIILLFAFTGSILLPIKAVLLNILSLSATLGVITWIFIEGNLAKFLGDFTITGTVDTGMIILMLLTTFGLSMDYEVFLLSRVKEEYERRGDNTEAVAYGLQKSARIVTAAALILSVVFASFVLSGVTSIKILGLGVAFAILLDATIVRALLVPALMRMFGRANWWAPKALKRFSISH